eukprot:TRINITY_DN914_c0_g1_i4.p2 TRINITY_DN914_c0_g1~~TRINITY_DN914_c0_g1_i4.p2  ORF type:complete len:100 (+),score=22.08 TRINITY_DN914_c0_g1_i4:184-483(+)
MSDREKYGKEMDRWIGDENMWIRRTALIHQLSYKDQVDSERLFRYVEARMHEEEFFIRKAIGWALRQYSKANRPLVAKFLEKNKAKLSTLSFREGSKYV